MLGKNYLMLKLENQMCY